MDISTSDQLAGFAVLLLHGLYAHADELKPIAAKLNEQFGKTLLIMQPTCRTRLRSILQSIDQQAENMLKWVQLELMRYYKDPVSFPLIIIGYSQGGVLACTLGQSYKSQLNILGIITLNAPLMGTPLLERTRKDVQEFIAKAAAGLQLIGYPLSRIKWSTTLAAWMFILVRLGWVPVNGLKDIFPNSSCMKGIYRFLKDSIDIPCLLIGTHQDDLLRLFNINTQTANDKQAIERLNDAYTLFITGKKGAKHDTLIPLASQLCGEDDANNLISTDTKELNHRYTSMTWPNRPQIKRRMYKGILHASNLIAIDPDLLVTHGETVLYANPILTDLIQFIKELIQNVGKVLKR